MKKETKIKTWAFFMRLGNKCGCHQMEERSFKIKGYQFPVCSRCTGILTGQIIGIIIYLLKFSDILKKILPQNVANKNHIAPIPGI